MKVCHQFDDVSRTKMEVGFAKIWTISRIVISAINAGGTFLLKLLLWVLQQEFLKFQKKNLVRNTYWNTTRNPFEDSSGSIKNFLKYLQEEESRRNSYNDFSSKDSSLYPFRIQTCPVHAFLRKFSWDFSWNYFGFFSGIFFLSGLQVSS